MAADESTHPIDDDGPILGVVLAAGRSSRFDQPTKLVEPLDGRPLVVHATQTLVAASSVDDVVVVTGHAQAAVRTALEASALDVPVRHNPDFDAGQATSVATGAQVAQERDAAAVVFALGDMPAVDPSTVHAIVRVRGSPGAAGIVIPTYDGRRGNPVCFDRRHFQDLVSLPDGSESRDERGDAGARTLFDNYPVDRVAVDDPGIHCDVDTPADLEAVRAQWLPK